MHKLVNNIYFASDDDVLKTAVPLPSGHGTVLSMDEELSRFADNVGKNVRRERLRRGLSQTDLADAAKLPSHAAISRIETGVRKTLDVEQLHKIAKVLDVPLETLFYGPDGKAPSADSQTEQRQRIIDDVVAMLTDLKQAGQLDLSEPLFRPYAEAVADRAIAAERDVPLQATVLRRTQELISKS